MSDSLSLPFEAWWAMSRQLRAKVCGSRRPSSAIFRESAHRRSGESPAAACAAGAHGGA